MTLLTKEEIIMWMVSALISERRNHPLLYVSKEIIVFEIVECYNR